jgi:glycosyltransferase involved in cell wall biosynthesis
MPNNSVSAVIPAKNASPYILETINAIKRQNHDIFEIVVIDDDSTDNTGEIARNAGCNVFRIKRIISCQIKKRRNQTFKRVNNIF